MVVIVYIATIVAFCVAAWVMAYLLLPIVMLYRAIIQREIPPTHPVFLFPFVVSAVILMGVTRFVWLKLGHEPGWLLIGLLIGIHLLFGSARGANRANQTQAYGTVFGLILYGILSLFRWQ